MFIISPEVIQSMKIMPVSQQLVLKTPTEGTHWYMKKVTYNISTKTTLKHQILVADIVDDFVLILNVMRKFKFILKPDC